MLIWSFLYNILYGIFYDINLNWLQTAVDTRIVVLHNNTLKD